MANELFPAISWIDAILAQFMPLVIRMSLFGLVTGAVSMLIYRAMSDQRRIARLKSEGRDIRRRLLSAEPSEFKALVVRNTKISGLLLARVFGPSLVSALPVLVFAAWMAIYHGYEIGAREVAVGLRPPASGYRLAVGSEMLELPANGATVAVPVSDEPVVLRFGGRTVYSGMPFAPPVPAITERPWWALLVESEAGYLEEGTGIEALAFDVAPKRLVPGLPGFLAGWELVFFASVFLSSLGLKLALKVE